MQALRNTFNRLWAALIMFTRLPWWRIHQPEKQHYAFSVRYWSMVGWITGGLSMALFALLINVWSLPIVAIAVVAGRMLLTGALHEDGLADFCDGMGGGSTRERILQIMKDSHIGTYGVLGLVIYLLTLYFSLRELTLATLPLSMKTTIHNPILIMGAIMLSADVWGKCCATLTTKLLPYARSEEEAKTKTIYAPIGWISLVLHTIIAMAPVALLWLYIGHMPHPLVWAVPLATECLLVLWMRKAIGGYTGDCCGASFLLCELSIYLTWMATLC